MRSALALLWCWYAQMVQPAVAGVVPEVSRVVIQADAAQGVGAHSLRIFNANPYPVLVQAWVDDGALGALPQESTAPLMVLPPIFRLEEGAQHGLRLLPTGTGSDAGLPGDREALYWLNLYELPETPKDPAATSLTVTMRMQVKVFMRPAGLPFGPEELPGRLKLTATGGDGGVLWLELDNPTPYHATISQLELRAEGSVQRRAVEMMAPFSRARVRFDAIRAPVGGMVKAGLALIDDDGHPVQEERELTVR
jgi:P pilus assembly chaperone PapD